LGVLWQKFGSVARGLKVVSRVPRAEYNFTDQTVKHHFGGLVFGRKTYIFYPIFLLRNKIASYITWAKKNQPQAMNSHLKTKVNCKQILGIGE
jgi:hypothetical protein